MWLMSEGGIWDVRRQLHGEVISGELVGTQKLWSGIGISNPQQEVLQG